MLFQEPTGILNAAEEVARVGARELARFWRRLDDSQVSEKARNDLVSAADQASEAAIMKEIGRRYPEHRILSEEAGDTGGAPGAPTWIVDPLDGTTNFVHGIPQWAISVAIAVDDRVQIGVILDPLRDDVFRAARGHGTWWNGEKVTVSKRTGLAGALLATGFPFRAHSLLDAYLAIFRDVFLRAKAIRRPGAAALDLAWTAAGLFDGFFEFRLSAWDVAAGSLLVEEAGGVVTDMDGGDGYLSSGNLVCGTPGVHAELIEAVQRHQNLWR